MAVQNICFPRPPERVVQITTPDVGKVTAAIPTAKPTAYRADGMTDIEVEWTFENMQTLTTLLQPAVSTIFDGYAFAGRDKPFYHQLQMAEFLSRCHRGYCFGGMGVGKTRATLWALDYLMTIGAVRKALVVCPKSLMYSAWVDDIGSTCIHRTYTVLYGERAQREKLLQRNTEIDIINFDGVDILKDKLASRHYDIVIVDESTAYKDAGTRRWKALSTIVKPETRVWALTGTPTPQGAMDAYGQAKLVTPDRAPRTKTAYQTMVQTKVATFIWKDKRGWQDTVREMLQPAIYIRKADCLDLPPVTRTFIEVGTSAPQKAALDVLRKEMVAAFSDGHEVSAANAAVLWGKIRQIYAGAIYADDGVAMALDNSQRIKETIELIRRAKAEGDAEAAGGKPHSKSLVFVPFKHTLQVVSDALQKEFNIATISGDTSVQERKRILSDFQNSAFPEVIVAIPEAFSHGITATAASLTIWYAPPSRTETYLQACERTDRPGQTQPTTVAHLFGDKDERAIYENLMQNRSAQDALLAMYKQMKGTP